LEAWWSKTARMSARRRDRVRPSWAPLVHPLRACADLRRNGSARRPSRMTGRHCLLGTGSTAALACPKLGVSKKTLRSRWRQLPAGSYLTGRRRSPCPPDRAALNSTYQDQEGGSGGVDGGGAIHIHKHEPWPPILCETKVTVNDGLGFLLSIQYEPADLSGGRTEMGVWFDYYTNRAVRPE
jgi:hypothetical protein